MEQYVYGKRHSHQIVQSAKNPYSLGRRTGEMVFLHCGCHWRFNRQPKSKKVLERAKNSPKAGSQVATNCSQLKMQAADGKSI